MIPVRSLAEAAVYARATGHFPYERTTPKPGLHVWRCWWRDERRELVFVEQPAEGPSELLDAEAFAEVAHALLAGVPPVAVGFPRGEVRRAIEELTLALYAFDEAARDPAQADPAARAMAQERRLVWNAALPKAPEPRPIDALPMPAHGFAASPEVTRWIASAAPFPTMSLPVGWAVVDRAADGRFLLRHVSGGGPVYAWATRAGNDITKLEAVTGRDALRAHVLVAGVLEEVQRARLRATLRVGLPVGTAFQRLLAPGEAAVPVVEAAAGTETVVFLTLDLVDPSPRHAVLVVVVDAEGGVVGHRVVEGLDGWEMRLGIQEAAPALPGTDGSRPENAARDEATTYARAIAGAVEPLLVALLDPARAEAVRASLRPHPGDAAKVFGAADAERAEALYARLWSADPPRVRAPAPRVVLHVAVATAGQLADQPDVAATFPKRWAGIAARLVPERTWVAWTYVPEGGGRGEDFDGLVRVDDRWVWFPAPWRVLRMDDSS